MRLLWGVGVGRRGGARREVGGDTIGCGLMLWHANFEWIDGTQTAFLDIGHSGHLSEHFLMTSDEVSNRILVTKPASTLTTTPMLL